MVGMVVASKLWRIPVLTRESAYPLAVCLGLFRQWTLNLHEVAW